MTENLTVKMSRLSGTQRVQADLSLIPDIGIPISALGGAVRPNLLSVHQLTNDIAVGATIENSYMLAAQILYDAREMYDETEKQTFIEWAMDMSGYSEGHIYKYIQVYEQFGLLSSKIVDTKNPIPFMALVELTNKKVSKATVKKVLTKYNNKKPENRPTVKEVKAIIKEDAPPVVSRLTIVDVSTPYVDAMAQAILQPEGEQGIRSDLTSRINAGSEGGPSKRIVEQARAILREDPSSVQMIVDGVETVGGFYEQEAEYFPASHVASNGKSRG